MKRSSGEVEGAAKDERDGRTNLGSTASLLSSPMMEANWRIELLGGLRAVRAEQVVTQFRTQKCALLLAHLALACDGNGRSRTHSRDELADVLWPEDEPRVGRNSLRNALALLRRVLEPENVPHGAVLVASRASVSLNPAAITTDAADFSASIRAAASAADRVERTRCLAGAVDLYHGDFLAGYHDAWALQQREWLKERYFQALGSMIDLLEQAGDFDRALEYARHGVSLDSLREEPRVALMRLYAALGQPAVARHQYLELTRLLKQELDASPSPEARALMRGIERRAVPRTAAPGSQLLAPGEGACRAGGQEPTQSENRLVTLLLAEIDRSASPAPATQAGDHPRLVDAMVDAVLKYGGRIDAARSNGVVALFGAERTREDDPDRAIHAALAMRETAGRLGLQVTSVIETGPVAPNGAAVNLVAPLQDSGEPGQIRVGRTAYELTRRAFRFRPLGSAAYMVERALPKPEKARGLEGRLTPFIGREKELAELQAALAALLQGRAQVVTLIGEAGVGKSRLVAELKLGITSPPDPLPGAGRGKEPLEVACGSSSPPRAGEGLGERLTPLWLEGRALERSIATGYALFVDLLHDFFGWGVEEPEAERAARLVRCLDELVAHEALTAERADEIGPLLGNLLSLRFAGLSLPAAGTYTPLVTATGDWDLRLKYARPEQIRHQTLLAVRDLLVALARLQPLVLVLEDLHWADALSLDLLSLMMEALGEEGRHGGLPLLLLCVSRPERGRRSDRLGEIAARKCPERATELRLRELTPSQSRRLVEALLGSEDHPERVRAQILETARGNPFFMEEMVRSLAASGPVPQDDDLKRESAAAEGITVPATVQSLIRSRVDRLEPGLKSVLLGASVIGRVFRRRVLERMLGDATAGPPPRSLDESLLALAEEALIYEERALPEEEYSFQHVLAQEAIYQAIPEPRRQALHRQVGEAIEALHAESLEAVCEELAYHYERSDDDAKAIEYLLRAGAKSRQAYLNEEAAACLQRALERLKTLGAKGDDSSPTIPGEETAQRWRLTALCELGILHLNTNRASEAETSLRQAIEVAHEIGSPAREVVRLTYWLCRTLLDLGRGEEVEQLGEAGLARLGQGIENVEGALMCSVIGAAAHGRGTDRHPTRAIEFTLRPTAFLHRLPYCEELRETYLAISDTYLAITRFAESREWLQLLLVNARDHHDLRVQAESHRQLAWIARNQADFGEARSQMKQAAALFERVGDARAHAWSLYQLGVFCMYLGALTEAKLHLEAVVAARADQDWALYARAVLGRLAAVQGRRNEALCWLKEALRLGSTSVDVVGDALAAIDELYEDPATFRDFCERFREEHPDWEQCGITRWYLQPITAAASASSELVSATGVAFRDDFAGSLAPGWTWHEPIGDLPYQLEDGLILRSTHGRDLIGISQTAPRLLRTVSGWSHLETVCVPASPPFRANGGLLVWKDERNFLRLERGTKTSCDLSFECSVAGEHHLIGRGRLPSERVFLRLEHDGERVHALTSADGSAWFLVGECDFPIADPVEVGLFAMSDFDSAYLRDDPIRETAIRFERFELGVRE
jgi:DNA-binding SARP family transcriptional activator